MTTGPGRRIERSTGTDEVLVPVTLELGPIRRLLVMDVADDPTYRALEPQILDACGGVEVVLLAYRHDDHVELYAEKDSRVDPSGYDGLGRGLLGIYRTAFDAARFEVTDDGLKVDVAFTAPNGCRVDLHIREHLNGRRDHFPVLAPVGGTFATPAFFPFLWLPGMSFVPVRGTEVTLRVNGQQRTIRRLPLPVGKRRCLMARYDPDVMVCQLNPNWVTNPPMAPAPGTGTSQDEGLDIVEEGGRAGIAGVQVRRGDHTCAVRLDPPLPDPRALAPSARVQGTVTLQADGTTELQGRYELARTDGRAHLVINRIGPWRTRQRRPLLGVLFRLPIFRRWPTTYHWRATLDLSAAPGSGWTSRWSRVGTPRGNG
jgi:hypothetical protein